MLVATAERRTGAPGLALAALAAAVLATSACARGPAPACRLSVEVPRGEVGFGATVTVRATATCDDGATPAPIVWNDGTHGPTRTLTTPTIEQALLFRDRAGALPVSTAQGRVHVKAVSGGVTAEADVIAAHTQTGIPSVPVGASVYVYGGPGGSIQRFVPSEDGLTTIKDPATGFSVRLAAGLPDAMPLDCHRPECHPNELSAHALTRHASALQRALGTPPRGHDETCLRCHTSGGDAQLPGSFVDIARTVGFWPIPARPMTLEELPRDLRRLADVGCVACHGPARIPEPAQRPTAYGAGVCATCHDAPPRYRVVEEWRTCRMSALRPFAHEADCAGCHTAQGFTTRIAGVRWAQVAPETDEPVTCAACHDPHGPGSGNPRMLRRFDKDGGAGAGALCAECHRADLGAPPDVRLSRRLAPLAPQAEMAPRDCVRCHRPHVFRAAPPTPAEAAAGERFDAEIAAARVVLRRALPRARGCNRAAGPARDLAVVRDRIALVDGEGRALGDCNGDGRVDGAGEDPLLSDRIAATLYPRAYAFFLVERDRSHGAHDATRARRLLAQARGEDRGAGRGEDRGEDRGADRGEHRGEGRGQDRGQGRGQARGEGGPP